MLELKYFLYIPSAHRKELIAASEAALVDRRRVDWRLLLILAIVLACVAVGLGGLLVGSGSATSARLVRVFCALIIARILISLDWNSKIIRDAATRAKLEVTIGNSRAISPWLYHAIPLYRPAVRTLEASLVSLVVVAVWGEHLAVGTGISVVLGVCSVGVAYWWGVSAVSDGSSNRL